MENSTLQEAVSALKKDNYEAMKLFETDNHNYNAISAKEIETTLSSKLLKDELSILKIYTTFSFCHFYKLVIFQLRLFYHYNPLRDSWKS